jgi:nucleoside-diphosphate kinase
MDRTLVILKPDAVERGLMGEIVKRFEEKGFVIEAMELRKIDIDTAQRHYAEHQGKSFFDDLIAFITRSPSLLMVLAGPTDTFAIVRKMMGATDPVKAEPGTIRGDLAIENPENLVHGSDSTESAEREIELFFPGLARTN